VNAGGRMLSGGRPLCIRGTNGSNAGTVGAGSRVGAGDVRFGVDGRAIDGKRGVSGGGALVLDCGGRTGAFGMTIVRSDDARCDFGTRSTSGCVARVSTAGRPAAGRTRCESEGRVGFAFGSDRSLSKTGRSITLVVSSSGSESSGAGRPGGGAAGCARGARGAAGDRVAIGRMTGGLAPPIGRSWGRFGCGGGAGAGRVGGGGRPEPELPPPFFVVIELRW